MPHYWALDESLASVLAVACLRVGRAIQEALHPSGVNLITSQGRAAEQTVMHVHLHVLPRWEEDPVEPIWPPKRLSDPEALARTANGVRQTMRAQSGRV